MARIRDRYWTSTLRQLVKRILKRCCGCKRFNIIHYRKSSQGLIPTHRTKQDLPFSVIGRDYAGPFICKKKRKRDIKVYLLLFTCNHTRAVYLSLFTWSHTRAVHLEMLANQAIQEFIQALKQPIATRVRPRVIHSDNAKTFEKASNWIKKIYKDERIQEFLVMEQVKWKFNLSSAPCRVDSLKGWWG